MDTFSFSLSRAKALAAGQQLGLDLSSPSGVLPKTSGVELGYQIQDVNADPLTITFTVLHKPMFVSVGMIESHVRGLLNA